MSKSLHPLPKLVAIACLAMVAGAASARAQTIVLEGGRLLPQIRVEATVNRQRGRRPVSIAVRRSRPDSSRPTTAGKRAPSGRVEPRRPPVVVTAPIPADVGADADRGCLAALRGEGVPFVPAPATKGIQTPVEVTGPVSGVRLLPRARRTRPLMDCQLARALAHVAPALRDLGVSGLSFSGTYQYRNVKGTNRLSGHAMGLAIDVHALETSWGSIDVERDYPKDGASWQANGRRGGSESACVGAPPSTQGRVVRTVACRLRAHPSMALVIGPDDNHDHRNHLHLEAHVAGPRPLLSDRQRGGGGDGHRHHQGRRSSRR